jgi:hypothetical protein
MLDSNFEFISSLQYRVKALASQVKAFESGEKYATMKSECAALLAAKDAETRKLTIAGNPLLLKI